MHMQLLIKIWGACPEVTETTRGENSLRSQDINAEMMNALDAFLDKDTPHFPREGHPCLHRRQFFKPQFRLSGGYAIKMFFERQMQVDLDWVL